MVRRIVVDHGAIDSKGFDWGFQVTIPWVNRPTDSVQYDAGVSTGPETPVVIMNTPSDPEHWAYGEDGPRFDLVTLEAICLQARRAVARAKEIEER